MKHRQTSSNSTDRERRRIVQALVTLPMTLAGCGTADAITAQSPTAPAGITLNPTPPCADDDDDDPTPAQTEGPYFTANSPQRTSLREAGMTGTLLTLTGTVVDTSCQPIARAKLDFWQADNGGNYDNSGFRLRGHQYTDESGRYTLETIVPGLYPGRTRHIHVKAQAPNGRILTTQLYFPGESRNASDRIYSPALLMAVEAAASGRNATFTFVLTT
jgi:protocatechuate 3,4-dioxygenase beta subunit